MVRKIQILHQQLGEYSISDIAAFRGRWQRIHQVFTLTYSPFVFVVLFEVPKSPDVFPVCFTWVEGAKTNRLSVSSTQHSSWISDAKGFNFSLLAVNTAISSCAPTVKKTGWMTCASCESLSISNSGSLAVVNTILGTMVVNFHQFPTSFDQKIAETPRHHRSTWWMAELPMSWESPGA